ncbi:collagenase [Aeromonas sp. R6-2]|uniref:M9 family metallopeptidase n=1 Tax=Aeromonas sp. R6-2 TaxID=3138472 RepID=UPI0034A3E890
MLALKPLACLLLAGWASALAAAEAPVSLPSPAVAPADLAGAEHGLPLATLPAPKLHRLLPPPAALELAQDPHVRRDREPDWRAQAQSLLPEGGDCRDPAGFLGKSGAALADYLEGLPDVSCTYGLFSLTADDGARIYGTANLLTVAQRFQARATNYQGRGRNLANLVLYLRAGYYNAIARDLYPEPPLTVRNAIRVGLDRLLGNPALFIPNPDAGSTIGESFTLMTNLHDETYYLPRLKPFIARFTNRDGQPNAADALKRWEVGSGYTGLLTVLFMSHYRDEGRALAERDGSYAEALFAFVEGNQAALLGTRYAYQLTDSLNEALRYMQYPAHYAASRARVEQVLAQTSLDGPGADLWLAAASAVKYYDGARCAEYGTCDFELRLADIVLPIRHECGPTLRIRAQDMTEQQLIESCAALATEEQYFHRMLKTRNRPLPGDVNDALEVVVFDDYANYSRYAGVIYGIATNNGGMYLEGDPGQPGNQARFIAHEASWLRPQFSVWNLKHEYVHYLDGRFNMAGDFARATRLPTVWWIEGLAEYLSLGNDNAKAIEAAQVGTYSLSTIFGNTYGMNDYVTRAYRWGYMAVRYMFEHHRDRVDDAVAGFRAGDYDGYWSAMQDLAYDDDFAAWAKTATTAGNPPEPDCGYPNDQVIDATCARAGIGSDDIRYFYVFVPRGTTRLTVQTGGGSGDANLYVMRRGWPNRSSYDQASAGGGNDETVTIQAPEGGSYYHIAVDAGAPYRDLTLSVGLAQ